MTNAKELTKYRQNHKKSLISRVELIQSVLLTFFLAIQFGPLIRSAPNLLIFLLRLAPYLVVLGLYQHVLVTLSQALLYVLQMKCLKYWPDTELEIGPFILTLDTEDVFDQYTLRYLIVQHQVWGSLIKFFRSSFFRNRNILRDRVNL